MAGASSDGSGTSSAQLDAPLVRVGAGCCHARGRLGLAVGLAPPPSARGAAPRTASARSGPLPRAAPAPPRAPAPWWRQRPRRGRTPGCTPRFGAVLVAYACLRFSHFARIPARTVARRSVRDPRAAYGPFLTLIVGGMDTASGARADIKGVDPRDGRRDAAGAALAARRGPEARPRREARGAQPGRVDQGPRGARADRGRRARRATQAGRHDHRADQRQHRHRPRDGGIAQGLPRDRGDAGQDVQGEDRPAARIRRRGRRGAHRGAARLARVLLPRRRPADRRDPRRVPAQPVPQRRQPGGPLPHHRPRAVAPVGRPDNPSGGRRGHRGNDHGRRAATCASRTPTS